MVSIGMMTILHNPEVMEDINVLIDTGILVVDNIANIPALAAVSPNLDKGP